MKKKAVRDETLRFSVYNGGLEIPPLTGFELWKEPDYVNYMEEDAFWIDLYAEILHGYRVLLYSETHVRSMPIKRRFLPDIGLIYYPNTRAENMKKYLESEPDDVQWCEIIVPRKEGKQELPNKMLYVYTKSIDRKIIEINYMEGEPEVWFDAYPQEGEGVDFEALRKDPLYQPPQPALIIADQDLFFLNPEQYPVEQLVSRIRTIAEKYSKPLEVTI